VKTILLSFTSFVVVIALTLGLVGWGVSAYVKITREQVALDQAWSRVENAFLHRNDLLPDLVTGLRRDRNVDPEAVARIADGTERVSRYIVSPGLLTDSEELRDYLEIQDGLTATLKSLLEDCDRPRSCGGEHLAILRTQIEHTQQQIIAGRKDLNEALDRYNDRLGGFPESVVAGFLGFRPMTPAAGSAEG
jgi:LemA protein